MQTQNNKSPAFQFYPKHFLSDINVQLMDAEQVGGYWMLVCHCWENDGLPNDPKVLSKLSKLGKKWPRKGELILNCFKEEEGFLVHPRLKEDRKKQEERKKELSESGRKGANKRWGGHSQAKKSPIAKNSSSSTSPPSPPDPTASSPSSSNNNGDNKLKDTAKVKNWTPQGIDIVNKLSEGMRMSRE